jgi:hypothetical protein
MYSINLLNDKQFDSLPYKDVDISLGLADYKNKRAYVRESGIPALDLLVMGHEIQELVADVSPHEEDGIRYKKGGWARSIVPMILGGLATVLTGGGAAPLLGATMSALVGAGVGAASGAGMGAYAESNHPELKGATLTGALGGGLGGWGLGQAGLGALAGWGSASGQGAGAQLLAAGKGALGGVATQGPVTAAQAASGATTLPSVGGIFGTSAGLGRVANALPFGKTALGQTAYASSASNLLNNYNSQVANVGNKAYNQTNTNDNFVPNSYYSFNSGLPYSSNTQAIKPTPSLSGFSSSLMNSGFMGGDQTSYADAIIPGVKYQPNIFTWR